MIQTIFVLLSLVSLSRAEPRVCAEYLTRGQSDAVLRLMNKGTEVRVFTKKIKGKNRSVVVADTDVYDFKSSREGQLAQTAFEKVGFATRSSSAMEDIGIQAFERAKPFLRRLEATFELIRFNLKALKKKRRPVSEDELREDMVTKFGLTFASFSPRRQTELIDLLKQTEKDGLPFRLRFAGQVRDFAPSHLKLFTAREQERVADTRYRLKFNQTAADFEAGAKRDWKGWLRFGELSLFYGAYAGYIAYTWPGPWSMKDPYYFALYSYFYYETIGYMLNTADFGFNKLLAFYPFRNYHVRARDRAVARNVHKHFEDSGHEQVIVVTNKERRDHIERALEKRGFDLLPLVYTMATDPPGPEAGPTLRLTESVQD